MYIKVKNIIFIKTIIMEYSDEITQHNLDLEKSITDNIYDSGVFEKSFKNLLIAYGQDKIEKDVLEKAWSSDLQKKFPNGSWRTINGARVFIDGKKVIAGLDKFNGMIDDFFKEKKGKPEKKVEDKKDEKIPELVENAIKDGSIDSWNGTVYGGKKKGYSVYLNRNKIEVNDEEIKALENYKKKKEEVKEKDVEEKEKVFEKEFKKFESGDMSNTDKIIFLKNNTKKIENKYPGFIADIPPLEKVAKKGDVIEYKEQKIIIQELFYSKDKEELMYKISSKDKKKKTEAPEYLIRDNIFLDKYVERLK